MLKRLWVKNFALIEEAELWPDEHLNVITGETGAGKSILLEALAIAGGERVESSLLADHGAKTIVEAEFDISSYGLQEWFEQNNFDYADELLLRREVSAGGRSRGFINDTPATLSQMKELSSQVMHILSQHESLLLQESSFQMRVLDAYAQTEEEAIAYKNLYDHYKKLLARQAELESAITQYRQQLEYNKFQYDEISALGLEREEYWNILFSEIHKIEHAEEIIQLLREIIHLNQHEKYGLLASLSAMKNLLNRLSKISSSYEEYAERAESQYLELKELFHDLEREADKVEIDPQKAEQYKKDYDALQRLLFKHGKKDIAELKDYRQQLLQFFSGNDEIEKEYEKVKQEIQRTEKILNEKACQLSDKRKKALKKFAEKVIEELASLNFREVAFEVKLEDTEHFTALGKNKVTFLFSANKGNPLYPLGDVASGGEKSRIMLALQYLIAQRSKLPLLVLDEVDVGISGDTAAKVADYVEKMSQYMQLILITHLPQMASRGNCHFEVRKSTKKERSVAHIVRLNDQERIMALATMLSSGEISKEAIENAKFLLQKK